MLQAFEEHIDRYFPELHSAPFLIAVSGGVDSIVLAHLCKGSKLRFGMAHVNYKLRGASSDADAAFVAELAARWEVPLYTTVFDTISIKKSHKGSLQELARDLRYTWFSELVAKEDFSYVLTAHHANDDLETFFLNISRGAGLKGLSGIPARRDFIIRPLLNFSKENILDYANKEGLAWREDPSNETDAYQRNAFRHQVIPKIMQVEPDFLAAFLQTRSHLRSAIKNLDNYIQSIKKQIFIYDDKYIKIPLDDLAALGRWKDLAYPLLAEYGFTDWQTLEQLDKANSGVIIHSETHEILKDRGVLLLRTRKDMATYSRLPVATDGLQLIIESVPAIGAVGMRTLYIDKESLKHRLNVRKWKKGDYFYPLGMGGKKKKLSKFFKDIKLDVYSKEEQWLLCDGEDIVWVIGLRADDRFKVQPETHSIIRIRWID